MLPLLLLLLLAYLYLLVCSNSQASHKVVFFHVKKGIEQDKDKQGRRITIMKMKKKKINKQKGEMKQFFSFYAHRF